MPKKKDLEQTKLEKKVAIAKEKLAMSQMRKALNMPVPKTDQEYRVIIKKEARAIPKELRQSILNELHNSKTIGEVQESCGVSMHCVLGVIELNMTITKYKRLNTKTV